MSQLKVFISHSAKEPGTRDLVERLYQALNNAGHAVRLDQEDLLLGDNWRSVLNFWIGGCHAAVLLLSPAALESDFVNYEASVLTYRDNVDDDFLLIPVLVDPVDDGTLRASRLEPTRIQEVQSRVGGTHDQIVRQVCERLEQARARATPLDRATNYLAHLLKTVPSYLLEDIAGTLRLDPGPWTPEGEVALDVAQKMLAEGLSSDSVDALRDLRADLPEPVGRNLEGLINLLGSSWVDYHASKRLPELARGRHDMGINGVYPLTARMYVIRGGRFNPKDPWKMVEVTGVAGEDLDEALPREIRSALNRLLGTRNDRTLKQELAVFARNREPIIVALPAQGLAPETLASLRTEFEDARFFLLTGAGTPPPGEVLEEAGVELLTPVLQPGLEDGFCCRYQNARDYLLEEEPDENTQYPCASGP